MDKKNTRVAFIGVSHWHVPLYIQWLLPPVKPESLSVVGVSDETMEFAEKYATQLKTKAYEDYRKLLDEQHPDFVFAFGRHDQMVEISHELINRKIGFTIEKPLGLTATEVEGVLEHLRKERVFCAIPFIWRYSELVKQLRENAAESFVNFSFKFIAGPPSRYTVSSPWMLDKTTAGGGCMTNLGVHFLDLALYLTDSQAADVLGADFHYLPEYDIETYGTALLKTSSGASVVVETGYAFPMDDTNKRVNRWDIITQDGYHIIADNHYEKRVYNDPVKIIQFDTDSDIYYETFAKESLQDFLEGNTPKAGLEDMLRVRILLDKINERQVGK